MRIRFGVLSSIAAAIFTIGVSSASAVTLGTTTIPSGASPGGCLTNYMFTEGATDSAYQYAVPAGGGRIASWSVNTTSATAGTPLTFLALQASGNTYKVLDLDHETLPNPLPVGNVASFPLASPWTVGSGDVIGLYATTAGGVACFFSGGTISTSETLAYQPTAPAPAVGTQYTTTNQPAYLANVSAELLQNLDIGVTGAANPATITAGGASAYVFTVANTGISSGPATFTDGLPGGLNILAAVAGAGTCTAAGQLVTCTIPNLEAGASVPVVIVVSAPGAGSYPDAATVSTSSPIGDANAANNAASATLTVNAPPAPPAPAPPAQCKLVRLTGLPLATAKALIAALNCKVGKVTSKASRSVRKGLVVSTSPGAGASLPAGTTVNVVVSAGPPKKRHPKRH